MLRKILYHIAGWIICFFFANYTEVTGVETLCLPLFLYRNIASFIMFYILWWLGIKYHNRVDVLIERKLSGRQRVKYRFLNWPFLVAVTIALCYLFGGMFIDAHYITGTTTEQYFIKRNEHYQSRLGFAGCSMLMAYFFTLRDHVNKRINDRQRGKKQNTFWNADKTFNPN